VNEVSAHIPNTLDCRHRLTKHPSKSYSSRPLKSITKIAVHHSLTKSGSAEAYARYHVNKSGWPGIGYHFVIEKDGTVKWCNDLTTKSYHVGNSNSFAVGICLTGDFREQVLEVSQHEALLKLLKYLLRELGLTYRDVLGHNEFKGYDWKSCPCIDMAQLRSSLTSGSAKTQEPETSSASPKNWKQSFDPSVFLVNPGESIITAASRFGFFDLGDIQAKNKTEDLTKPKLEPTPIKVVGPEEKIEDQTSQLIDSLRSLGHKVFTGDAKPHNLNIVGVRNQDSTPNAFDDKMHVFWKFENKWTHKTYQVTTDPGTYYLNNPMNVDGTAIMKEGQYLNAYKFGKHRQKYTALVQAQPVTVIRDFDRDSEHDFDSGLEQTGFFYIHIHHASYSGKSSRVDKWSAGCQVFADIKEYDEFINLCRIAQSNWGDTFTYTLINSGNLTTALSV
jgi:hypothetical protein